MNTRDPNSPVNHSADQPVDYETLVHQHAGAVIERYLAHINQVSDGLDPAELAARMEHAGSPLEKLKLHSRIETAAKVDEARLIDDFVRVAKHWSDKERITPGAFLAMGVPREVLVRAGILPTDTSTVQPAGQPTDPATDGRTVAEHSRNTSTISSTVRDKSRPSTTLLERMILLTVATISALGALVVGFAQETPAALNLLLLPILLFAPGYAIGALFNLPPHVRTLVAPPLSVAAGIGATWTVNLLGHHGTNIPNVSILAISALLAAISIPLQRGPKTDGRKRPSAAAAIREPS